MKLCLILSSHPGCLFPSELRLKFSVPFLSLHMFYMSIYLLLPVNLVFLINPVFLKSSSRSGPSISFGIDLYFFFLTGWNFSDNFGSLSSHILSTCSFQFFYVWISSAMLCTFNCYLIATFLWRSNIVYRKNDINNLICAASKCCSSLLCSTHASLPNLRCRFPTYLVLRNLSS